MTSQRLYLVPPALALLVVSCRDGGPPLIGDAYPRDTLTSPFLAAIRPAIESTGVRIQSWTVRGDRGATIQLNSEQAAEFAENAAVVAVVGHAGSRDALLGAAVYNASGLPHVVPNATSRRLATAGPWTFPLVPNDSIEGEFLAAFAIDSLQARRLVVFYLGDEYGIGLRDGVQSALELRGSALTDATMVPGHACSSPVNSEIFASIAQATMKRANPDVVVLATGTENGWCLADLVHAANRNAWILCADGMDACRHPPAAHTNIVRERLRGVEFWIPGDDSVSRAFVRQVRTSLHRVPTASEALQFDAFRLLATAVREAGTDRRAIRGWLESLGRTRPPVAGVTGPIAFNRPRTEILRMSNPSQVIR